MTSSKCPPRYRIEREANEEKFAQEVTNLFRRLFGLPIMRTGLQAFDEHMKVLGACSEERRP
jgi:hypothetical protein